MGSVRLVPVAAVLGAAVWWGGDGPGRVAHLGALAVACAALWVVAWWGAGRGRLGLWLAWLVLAACGALRGAGHREWVEAQRRALGQGERVVRCQAVVASHPTSSPEGPSALVSVLASDAGLPRGARLGLRFAPGTVLAWGGRVSLLARVRVPPPDRNPGGRSAARRWAAIGVAATGRAFTATPEAPPAMAWPASVRQAVQAALQARLDGAALELVQPLVLGDWSPVSPTMAADLRRAGLTHLLALSGLHVTWFAALARLVVAASRPPRAVRAMTGAAAAAFYWCVAGTLPSLARAAVSELWSAAARLAGRALDGRQALAGSVVALLALHPGWVADVGFQLSCAATAGLLCVGGVARATLPGRLARLASPALPTLAAQVGALPWLIVHFHAVSLAGFAANVVAVPLAALLLGAAWLALALHALAAPLARPCFAAAEAAAAALRAVTGAASAWPGAVWATGHDPLGIAVLALGLAGLFAMARPAPTLVERESWNPRRRVVLGLVAVTLAATGAGLALTGPTRRPPPGRIWAVFLDVGQGDACALGFPDGSWWLVDAGPRSPLFDAGESVVVPFLRWAGVRELETVAITHADADHIGGTAAVLRALPARRLLLPAPTRSVPGPWSLYHGARSRAVARGDTVRPLPAVVVVWPPREGPGREPADARLGATAAAEATPGAVRFDTDNRRCLVLRVQDALLLTGDADTLVERELTAEPPVALLKVAHHGSASSTGAAWLDAVRPAWALVSCGRDNPFGHPHPAVVRRLEERGVAIWRTDREGAAWLEWDGRAWRSLAWRGRDGLRSPPAAQAAVPGGMGGLADRANALAGPERAR